MSGDLKYLHTYKHQNTRHFVKELYSYAYNDNIKIKYIKNAIISHECGQRESLCDKM